MLGNLHQGLARIFHKTYRQAKPALRASLGMLVSLALLISSAGVSPARVVAAPVGAGFALDAGDLRFILTQIKISETHVANTTVATGPCGALLGPGLVSEPRLPFGLRTVDGSCNHLLVGQQQFGAADEVFPRMTASTYRPGEFFDPDGPGPAPAVPTSYTQKKGVVADSQPRIISNLVVDQTSSNPAAVAVAGPDCAALPPGETCFIPNIAPDVGLSASFNPILTFFGQFFDHGLDLVNKGKSGAVFVPLQPDDPLFNPAPGSPNFLVLTRATNLPGPDGIVGDDPSTPLVDESADDIQEGTNQTTPFVDQNQTYTSHPSHQVFLREYEFDLAGDPVPTGRMIDGALGNIGNWAEVKAQAATMLGIQLVDSDVFNVPLLATDPYGHFMPGPNGFPQIMTASGPVEGDPAANGGLGVLIPADAFRTGHAFLDDIAHSAAPGTAASPKTPDADLVAGGSLDPVAPGEYDNELLDLHFITGDGRGNENIALTAVHTVFHSEHNRLRNEIDAMINNPLTGLTAAEVDEWKRVALQPGDPTVDPAGPNSGWAYGERLFQAARFVTEMQYQHLVFEEFARKLVPQINPFIVDGINFQSDTNPAIPAEFAHAVYRLGHSMLTETVNRTDAAGTLNGNISLFDAFLNPVAFNDHDNNSLTPPVSAAESAGVIFQGLSGQAGNEIDEFVTDVLRNRLVGLPLDLATINLARGRSEGIPPLNDVRRQLFEVSGRPELVPYESWMDYSFSLKHQETLVNLVAAYGTHTHITTLDPDGPLGPITPGSLAARRMAADQIVNGTILPGPDGILGADPSTALDDTPAIPEGPGPDGELLDFDPGNTTIGLVCTALDTPAGCDETADNTPAVPAGPGPDGILGPNPATAADDILPPADSLDFMFSVGAWTGINTGLENVDLWIGGLAERQSPFGGLLGSTFNYVFEITLENLQNADRFYYLERLDGLNLLVQLEGNSLGELIMRNTTAQGFAADVFSRADLVFNLDALLAVPGVISDDPATLPDESAMSDLVLVLNPGGTTTIRYIGPLHVIWNGRDTVDVDRIRSSEGDDTLRGNGGPDIMEGGDGNDQFIGGAGDDILTDIFGDDVIKGGDGNDVISSGPGLDLNQGGPGNDFMVAGSDGTESFGGPGNDFIYAGEAEDTVFGDAGDDWIEGGAQLDLLQGDFGNQFQNDPNGGHDVISGGLGDDDYDAEGGDDIMIVDSIGTERAEGMLGFDWVTYRGDPLPVDADMLITGLLEVAPDLNELRDRFDLVEGLSGYNKNDLLRGDNRTAVDLANGAFGTVPDGHVLTAAGIARIDGLAALLPVGATEFRGGNIILGGEGNDLLEGRGGDDILDGDRWLNVQLQAPDPATADPSDTKRVNSMTQLRADVLAGRINPGDIVIIRSIVTPVVSGDCSDSFPTNCDTAVFSGALAEYTITFNPDGSVTVDHLAGTGIDGVDTLWNMERAQFADQTILLTPAPMATVISPTSLAIDFGTVAVADGPSTPQTITIQNTGSADLLVSGVSVTGADAASFSAVAAPACAIVAPGGFCVIDVTFDPATTGPKAADVSIAHNASGSPIMVGLSGIGGAPVASVSPASLAFGSVTTGTTSAPLSITVSNTGNTNLVVSGVALSGPNAGQFTIVVNACGTVAPAGSCNIDVAFAPTTVGAKSAQVDITHNAAGSPSSVTLSGTGVALVGPTISIPANTAFGTRRVGTTRIQTIRVTNLGPGTLVITSATTSAPFIVNLGTCAAPVAAGRTCRLIVAFTPTAIGPVSRTLTVVSNASNSPTIVTVSGTGR
jgi:Ca2+-binding RTX toxin-like protein